jgi:hypothetical protein
MYLFTTQPLSLSLHNVISEELRFIYDGNISIPQDIAAISNTLR